MLTLPGSALPRLYPFYMLVDAVGRLVEIGPSLQRLPVPPRIGAHLEDEFEAPRTQGREKLFDHVSQESTLLLLRHRHSSLQLRGESVRLDDGGVMILSSPWVGEAQAIEALGLTLGDFAVHDPVVDLVSLLESYRTALEDVRQANLRLIKRRTELASVNDELIEKNATAQRLAQEMDVIFKLSPDGFLAFNRSNILTYANPAFVRLTGVERNRGESMADLETKLMARCAGEQAYVSIADCPREGDTLLLTGPPQTWLLRQVRTLPADSDDTTATVVYLRDITREKEIERMKSEFLSTAAHELRTPMASIHGFAELLLARKFDEAKQRDMLSRIHRQSSLLTQMVNELLDLARIEARRGKDFLIRPQALAPIVQETLAALVVSGDARQVHVSLPEDLPEVNVDAAKTRQALTNVLSNAYKYSPAGGDIDLSVQREGDYLVVAVRDQGLGMTPEQLTHAFERFWRADTSGNIPGTGLGLCVVKEIVDIQGGSVAIDSEAGKGTQVVMRFPVAG